MDKHIKKILRSFLYYFLRDKSNLLLHKLAYYVGRPKMVKRARSYNKRKPSIIEEKSHKNKIKILFFVLNLSMWKYDGLIKLLLKQQRYEPIIVPFVSPFKSRIINKKDRDKILEYCKINSIPYREGFDFETNQYLDITDIHPDIVIYTQPYDTGYERWRIDNYINNSLFIYTSYSIPTTPNKEYKDTYLNNIAWKIFVSCQLEKKIFEDNMSIKDDNIVVTGATILDDLQNADIQKSPWRDNTKKRLIWAPHHSIDSLRGFSNSNFERMCFDMLDIAKKYKDKIEIAFKPHPTLRERLNDKWGIKKTDEYYFQWSILSNTFLCEGNYIELFAFSDAMVHDSASFTYEYLCTGKPVMFICKDEGLLPPIGVSNELGLKCFEHHYHGYSIRNIETFINEVIIEGHDIMKENRNIFVKKEINIINGKTVAENMLHELESLS